MNRLKIKNIVVINNEKLVYTLYKYTNRIFELQIVSRETNYQRHLKNKEAAIAFLTETDTKNYFNFRKDVEKISWETIDNLFDEKIKLRSLCPSAGLYRLHPAAGYASGCRGTGYEAAAHRLCVGHVAEGNAAGIPADCQLYFAAGKPAGHPHPAPDL